MKLRTKIALVGARGYVGQELLQILSHHQETYNVTYVTSREFAGRKVSDVFETVTFECVFEGPNPEKLAQQDVDIIVLGLPNGLAQPYIAALHNAEHPASVIDLSSDYRHAHGWVYGMPDLFADQISKARQIANPGCYATAATLALYPLQDYIGGPASIFGVSGYSGAGTTPSEKNDPALVENNLMPYAFEGHAHQTEISQTVGAPVRFLPHVAPFFRGLITTLSVPLNKSLFPDEALEIFKAFYTDKSTVQVQGSLPQIRQITGTPNIVIGGFAFDAATRHLSFVSVLDNLLKGAAYQCFENMELLFDKN